MPEFIIDFEVFCDCGAGLCRSTIVEENRGGLRLIIEPCEDCLTAARLEGREEGREEERLAYEYE